MIPPGPPSATPGGAEKRVAPPSNLILPNNYPDATRAGYDGGVPDGNRTTLSRFIAGILSGETPHAKIGTQVVVEAVPELRDKISPRRRNCSAGPPRPRT